MSVKKKKQSIQELATSSNKKNGGSNQAVLTKTNTKQNPAISESSLWQQLLSVGNFLGEVRAESRKISWPERTQVIRETISVLFLVAAITILVLSFDWLVGKFVFAPLEHWGHLYGINAGK